MSNAGAGTFLRKGLYITTDLTIGFGKNVDLAKKDAMKSIPKGYKIDSKNNSPAINCALKEIPNEKGECANEYVRVEMPLTSETK